MNVEESLYEKKKEKKRKFNWADTWEEFDDEYPGMAFGVIVCSVILGVIGFFVLLWYALEYNPWILAYAVGGVVFIFLCIAIIKFFKCAQYDD